MELGNPSQYQRVLRSLVRRSSRYKELYALEPNRRLRETRDNLITLTDWVLMPDVTMSEEKLEEWKTYRKALRDLPSITTPTLCEDGIRLLNVTWPTKPQ